MCLWGWAEKVSRQGKRKPSCPELEWLVGGWGGRWARLKTREKNLNLIRLKVIGLGLPWWLAGKESSCQCRRHGFNSWSMKIPHATEPLSLCSSTIRPALETGSHNYRSPRTTEPVLCYKRSRHNEKPAHHNWTVSPCLSQLEKSLGSNK